MSYISHEDFKKMMDGFKKGSPKKVLNEMHTMDQDGADEFHKLPADHEEGLEKEGNAFTAGLAKAKKGEEFKVGGKTVKDTSNYDAHMSEEWDSPYDGGADDLAAMAKDEISKDTKGEVYHIGDKVGYGGHSFTIVIGPGGKAVLKHSTGKLMSPEESIKILKKAAIEKKFSDLDEYQFDTMYPDDPGPFESTNYTDPDESYFAMAVADQLNDEAWGLTPEQMDAAEAYLEDHEYELQGSFANNHEVGGGSTKAAKYIVDLIKKQSGGVEETIREFLTREDAVNWDEVDNVEDDINQTDDGIEEGINPAPMQATGQTIQTVEEDSKTSHLTSEEKEQVKQYIESIKTIKEEIAKLVNKGKMKEGGDTTGLVMTPSTVSEEDDMAQGGSEHEEIESHLSPKFHEAFHKITGMIIGDLVKAGFPEDQIKSFLEHEIEEKAKEWISGQYGENKLR